VKGPDVVWYLAIATFLFCTGALGVLMRRSPLIILLVAAVGGVILGSHSREPTP
jgi:NADH:ubiquinone oxidoreductase subunit K